MFKPNDSLLNKILKLIALFIILRFVIPLFYYFGIIFYELYKSGQNVGTPIPNAAVYIGKEVELPPFVQFFNFTKYGGWKDKYLYVMSNVPEDLKSHPEIGIRHLNNVPAMPSGYYKFKVTQAIHGSGDSGECVLNNVIDPKFEALTLCKNLEVWRFINDYYNEINLEITNRGKVLLAAKNYNLKLKKPYSFRDKNITIFEYTKIDEFVYDLRLLNMNGYLEWIKIHDFVIVRDHENFSTNDILSSIDALKEKFHKIYNQTD